MNKPLTPERRKPEVTDPQWRRHLRGILNSLSYHDIITVSLSQSLDALEAAEAEIERLRSPATEAHGETVLERGCTTVKARGRR